MKNIIRTFKKTTGKFSVVALVFAAVSCTSKQEPAVAGKFALTDSLISKLLIDTVEAVNSRTDLNFSAKITADEARMAEIFPMVSGTVQKVPVQLGDRVQKGQLLASISSSEMAGYDKEAISASAELKNAERNVKQAQQLFTSGLLSERELEESKNNYEIKRAENKRANTILKLNGSNKSGNYAINAPISGFIIEKNITSNMQLRPDRDKNAFTLADLSTVWAMINIYESDISRVREGDEVHISILSYPEKQFSGKVEKIYNLIDSESKVMNARVSIVNPEFLLKPGMMATVNVSASSGINLPVVNARGVIFDENKNYVLVIDPAKKVRIQEVEIGRKTADKVYISKGLIPGDRIVASKQVFLYESLKN
ncbi:efflux RND transporter periplasmic adaptor subunit [Pedobacter metabolipauper]|uniref:Cobalt-zinc-cadmium efflux system membrane fusion protein n=1 Tax=Pedobacter metabolipauper TaxID=425513 RepID=A0A4V3D0Q7_9SPHI|nr:efflux RND transporter periplasmic adaptor subunit [Pedobacter metabolipauper]TDQ06968.1 cobalt-zinc-cadmium efflux system membrane fusion protein [Pedobacter metabolipauper]